MILVKRGKHIIKRICLRKNKKTFLIDIFIFPFEKINKNSSGFDMECGSGRWAKIVAPKFKTLKFIDSSIEALKTAKKNILDYKNC